jgi:predicted transcriptional regulator
MTSRVTASLDDDLAEKLERQAEREGITKSELVSRGVEYYLNENSLEARVSDLEQRFDETERRVDDIEEEQNRGVLDKVPNPISRDRSPPG